MCIGVCGLGDMASPELSAWTQAVTRSCPSELRAAFLDTPRPCVSAVCHPVWPSPSRRSHTPAWARCVDLFADARRSRFCSAPLATGFRPSNADELPGRKPPARRYQL